MRRLTGSATWALVNTWFSVIRVRTPLTVNGIGWTGTSAVCTNGTPVRVNTFAWQPEHCMTGRNAPGYLIGVTVARKLSLRWNVSFQGTRKL